MTIPIKPLIVIGCGGTGEEVVSRIYRDFKDMYGDIPDVFQFIVFDSNQNVTDKQNLPNREYVNLPIDNPDKYLVGIKDGVYPELEWFGSDRIKKIGNASVGAKKKRPIGRLSAVLNMPTIRDILDQKITLLRNSSTRKKLKGKGYNIQKNINVAIVNSLGGGCGSGVFLDIAFNVKSLVNNEDCLKGYTISSQSFDMSKDKKPLIQANTFASCRELEHYMDVSNTFVQSYGRGMIEIESPGHPFDEYYIVGSDMHGVDTCLDKTNVVALLSNVIKLDAVSPVGQVQQGQLANVKHELLTSFVHPTTKRAHLKAYSSVGMQGKYYPIREIREICTLSYADDLANEFLRKCDNIDDVIDIVKNEMISGTETSLKFSDLFLKIESDSNLNSSHTSYLQENDGKINESLQKWKDDCINDISNVSAKKVRVRREQSQEKVIQELCSKIESVLNDPNQGLEVAIQVKDLISNFISNQENILNEKSGHIQKELENLEDECKILIKDIVNQISGSLVPFKQKRINKKINHFILLSKEIFEMKVKEVILQEIRILYINVENILKQRNTAHVNLRRNINLIVANLSQEKEKHEMDLITGKSKQDADLFEVIGNSITEIEYHYKQFNISASQAHKSFCVDGIGHWCDFTSDEISKEILQYSAKQYSNTKFDIGHVIENLDEMIGDLFDDTHLAMKFVGQDCGFDHTQLPSQCLLGVPEHMERECKSSVLKTTTTRDIQVVPMKGADEILLVMYKHAIPMMAMEPIVNIVTQYNNLVNGDIPLHIFDVKDLPEIC